MERSRQEQKFKSVSKVKLKPDSPSVLVISNNHKSGQPKVQALRSKSSPIPCHVSSKKTLSVYNKETPVSSSELFTSVEGETLPVPFRASRRGPKITIPLVIDGIECHARLDGGSEISVINPSFLSRVKGAVHKSYPVPPLSVRAALTYTNISQFVELKLRIESKLVIWGFHVMKGFTEDILFGTDFIFRDSSSQVPDPSVSD